MRNIAIAIKVALTAVLIAASGVTLFLVGDRGKHDTLLDKRRDAAWSVFRGVVGIGSGWAVWLATGQSLWLLIPVIVWPLSLYLVVSGIADLVLLHTRDRELLRREEAAIRRDQPILELAREARRSHALMHKAGMTDEEIERWASERIEDAQRKIEKLFSDAAPDPESPLPSATQRRDANQNLGGFLPWRDLAADQPSKEFVDCWQAAGRLLNSIGWAAGIEWLKADLTPPFLEHLSFRLGNQLFFVRVEDVEGRVDGPGTVDGLLSIAGGCKGWPCIMPMRRYQEGWKPDRPGWGLIDARTGDAVDPLALVTDERIEMTDWEVQDFAVQVVRQTLKKQGRGVLSSQGNPKVDPSIWFMENGQRAWVVVRAVRFPKLAATLPHNWRQIAKVCAAVSEVGYFASVAIAGGEEQQGERPDTRLLRGHPLYAKESSLKEPTEDEIDAAEKEFISRGRLASQHRRPSPEPNMSRPDETHIDQKTSENDAEWGRSIDYFAPPADPNLNILRKIKGNTRRAFVADAVASDGLASIPPGWLAHDLSDALKAFLGSQHPRARGGEDLPDLKAGEVEIARLTLADSVHGEVSSLRARRDPKTRQIMFRMVDEYETPITLPFRRAPAALTAEQVLQLFVESEPSQTETTCQMDFQSDFYPGLNDLARSRGLVGSEAPLP